MFCSNCGETIVEGASFCAKCGTSVNAGGNAVAAVPASSANREYVFSSKLASAILVTIFCCQPLGVPAIVYAARANAANSNGNLDYARSLNSNASTWIWISFGLGLLFNTIYLISLMAGA